MLLRHLFPSTPVDGKRNGPERVHLLEELLPLGDHFVERIEFPLRAEGGQPNLCLIEVFLRHLVGLLIQVVERERVIDRWREGGPGSRQVRLRTGIF